MRYLSIYLPFNHINSTLSATHLCTRTRLAMHATHTDSVRSALSANSRSSHRATINYAHRQAIINTVCYMYVAVPTYTLSARRTQRRLALLSLALSRIKHRPSNLTLSDFKLIDDAIGYCYFKSRLRRSVTFNIFRLLFVPIIYSIIFGLKSNQWICIIIERSVFVQCNSERKVARDSVQSQCVQSENRPLAFQIGTCDLLDSKQYLCIA